MKKVILFLILLTSCSNKTDTMIAHADSFIENSTKSFLNNDQGLLNYKFNPRTQFDYTKSKKDRFRVLINNDRLKFYCFSDSCLLDRKLGLNKSKYLKKGFYDINNDTIRLHFKKDSIIDLSTKFKTQPIAIFKKYKADLKKFNIHSYSAYDSIKRYYVYLNSNFVLIKAKKPKSLVFNTDKIIKEYPNKWILVKRPSK